MAKQPRPTDSGLPRRTPGRALDEETQPQPHPHGDVSHIHRMGQLPHDHDDDGRPLFAADAKFKPPAPDQQFGMVADGDYRPVPDGLGFVPPPDEAETADPPAAPSESGDALEPSEVPHGLTAGSGGGSGRPSGAELEELQREVDKIRREHEGPPPTTGRSIGRVIANTAIDAALGVPVSVQDERAHAREAVEILVEAAADHHRHNQPMPVERLLDLEAIVAHMVDARGVGR
jgi:hypothetical protein